MTKIMMMAVAGWFVLAVHSPAQTQVTNVMVQPPTTRLEAMENITGKIVFKARTEVGTVSVSGGAVTVFFKEDSFVGDNTKAQGVLIAIKGGGQTDARVLVDYDEIDSLAGALDYLSLVNWSATTMGGFDANYSTKAGLRFDATGNRRSGKIAFSVRNAQMSRGVTLAPEQLAQIRSLLGQAKQKLDELPKS